MSAASKDTSQAHWPKGDVHGVPEAAAAFHDDHDGLEDINAEK